MKAGAKLESSERVARALGVFFGTTRVPIIVVCARGDIVTANQAAVAQYGYTLDELFHMRVHDLQASARPIDADLACAFAGIDGGSESLERRPHRCKNGKIIWVVPTPNVVEIDGEPLLVSALKDVSALVGAEARAELDEERAEIMWQASVERLGNGFALLDSERRIVRSNQAMCALLERELSDVVGAHCWELFPDCRADDECAHRAAAAECRRIVREITDRSSGKARRVEVLPALSNHSGIATIHLLYDLTEERAARSELVTKDRLATIGRLAAGVAHEVNNPAGFVTLALQLLKDQISQGLPRPAEASGIVDEAIAAMLQINQIMRDLTGFTRERACCVTDLTTVANSAIRIASNETRERASVERAFADDAFANVRGARVAQVILNLIVNAAQAISPGDPSRHRIDVRVFRRGDRACIEVSDTGPGVGPGLGEQIFEPFFTTRESTGGTGLGLWLSRAIIEEEGGTLAYENLPGGGACFTISLPAARTEHRDPPERAAHQ